MSKKAVLITGTKCAVGWLSADIGLLHFVRQIIRQEVINKSLIIGLVNIPNDCIFLKHTPLMIGNNFDRII